MNRIASFTINHNTLLPGLYISREDGDITTYDLRFKQPNGRDYLQNGAMHTVEHLFATYIRNSRLAEHIIYFGPMGCRTGFYLLVRDLPPAEVIVLTAETLRFCADFIGEIPGVSAAECGHYEEHDLVGARSECRKMAALLTDYPVKKLQYIG